MTEPDFDVVIIGAGAAGLYALHRVRGLGLSARVYEKGDGVGSTHTYREICEEIAANGYEGFVFQPAGNPEGA